MFDRWAEKYDRDVFESDQRNEYPFAGYSKVLSFIWDEINPKGNARILDLGVGTGVLSSMLYEAGSTITALDFSSNMLRAAKEKCQRRLSSSGISLRGCLRVYLSKDMITIMS